MLQTFGVLFPETVLLVAACLFFLGGSLPVQRGWWGPLALLVLLTAAICLGLAVPSGPVVSHPLVMNDALSCLFRWVFLILGALFAASALGEQSRSSAAAEFYGLLLTLVAGMMVVASANELILLFLGLELISIPTYVLLYFGRRDFASQEAATKYFLLSVLSAAILLYGFSFLYGLTGTTHLTAIRHVLARSYAVTAVDLPSATGSQLGILALVLVFAGLGFKIAAVPFHFYAPDVYQGTTAWNAGLLAVAPKAAGFVALVRIASQTMAGFETSGETIALILAMVTMTAGNVLALLQTNIRRLLAYSSIAHAGYMLIGIASGFWESSNPAQSADARFGLPGGVQACLFYLIAYCLVTAGLFIVLVYLARPGKQIEHVEELTGLGRTHRLVAVCAAIFLFSLSGMPPLPGFWAKLMVFGSALSVRSDLAMLAIPKPWFVALAIVGALNAAIAAVYYLRIIAVMFLHDPLAAPQPSGGRAALAVVVVTTALTIGVGIESGPLLAYLRKVDQPGELQARTQVWEPVPIVANATDRVP